MTCSQHRRSRIHWPLAAIAAAMLLTVGGAPPNAEAQVVQHLDQGGGTSSSKLTAALQEVRNAYLAHEGPGTDKRIHVTEVGWTTTSVSQSTQATNLQIAYQAFGANNVARAFWFNVQDHSGLSYGLVTTSGAQKQAFQTYRQFAK